MELTTEDGCRYQYKRREVVPLANGLCSAPTAERVQCGDHLTLYKFDRYHRTQSYEIKKVVRVHWFRSQG